MASYHLSVKTVKRTAGRSAVAAAAYRAGARLACEREGRVHDYTRKQGIAASFIVAPDDAPDWAAERAALWNAAEDRETRRNAVTAREWELALPGELDDASRLGLAREFAQALVARYGIVCDVAVHAPHRDGDQRNHHAHILTTTRVMAADGLGAKTRILDTARTGGAEIEAMRGLWAGMQNRALERAGQKERVDHRSLEAQREAAVERGDDLAAMALDRDPEIKLGPAANALERKALRVAEAGGAEYVPVTDRGAQNHVRRQQRDLLAGLRARAEQARDAWVSARAQEVSRLGAAVEAAKALFAHPASDAFAQSFDAAWQALEEEKAQARLQRLEAEKARFIEEAAQAWEAAWSVTDAGQRQELQDRIATLIDQRTGRYGASFDDLAEPVNIRASEIHEAKAAAERLTAEKQQEPSEAKRTRARDKGWDYGM